MEKLLPLIFAILLTSCNSDQTNSQLKNEMAVLVKENDSLRDIMKNKYLFDHINFRIIPSEETPDYSDNGFKGQLVIVGYNNIDFVLMGDYGVEKRGFSKADTLKVRRGNYEFAVGNTVTKEVRFGIELNKAFCSKTYDSIMTVPYEYL